MQEDVRRPTPRKVADMKAATIAFHAMLGARWQGGGYTLVQGLFPSQPEMTGRVTMLRQRVSETGLTARENVTR
jgi:hypothetical protein